jgi:hypothetical protein
MDQDKAGYSAAGDALHQLLPIRRWRQPDSRQAGPVLHNQALTQTPGRRPRCPTTVDVTAGFMRNPGLPLGWVGEAFAKGFGGNRCWKVRRSWSLRTKR